MLAHGVHVALVTAGLAGLGSLLAPSVALNRRTGSRPGPRDAHDARVGALRAALAQYAAGGPVTDLLAQPVQPPQARPTGSTVVLPLAVTGMLAAAGVHAAMIAPHLRERLLLGAFFLGCALAQLAWTARALRRPAPSWLAVGAAGNLAVVALWAVTRTAGLPLGLVPSPEAVGGWDVACVAFELVAAGACAVAAGRPAGRLAPWREWHAAAYAWIALATTLLVVLSVSGGH